MTIKTASIPARLFTLSLIIAFVLSSLPLEVLAQAQEGSPENASEKGEGEGSGPGADPDSDGDGSTDSAESAEAAASQAEVSAAAEAAGVDIDVSEVDPVDDANNIGGKVSVNGVAMDKEAALSAIDAIAEAQNAGLAAVESGKLGIDVSATLNAHANGALPGDVIGASSGKVGHAAEVAAAEVAVATGRAAAEMTVALTDQQFNDRFGTAAAVPATDISKALTSAYTQFAETAQKGGILGLSGKTSTTFSYNETMGSWVNDQTGVPAGVNDITYGSIANFDALTEAAQNINNASISINPTGHVTVSNTRTGVSDSFNINSVNPSNIHSTVSDVETSIASAPQSKQSALAAAYQEYATTMTAAGQQGSNLSGLKSNTSYTFNPTTGNFVGNKNGVEVTPANIPNGVAIADFAKTVNHNAVVVSYVAYNYDPKTKQVEQDLVTVANTYTGWRGTFNSRSTAEITEGIVNYQASPTSIERESQLDYASLYSDKIAASQTISPVPSDNPELEAEVLASIMVAEAASLGKKGMDLVAEVVANRALVNGKTITSVVTAKGQFQPITEKGLNGVMADAKKSAHYETALQTAKAVINGSYVNIGLTKDGKSQGYVNFANVPLTASYHQTGKASNATWGWVSAVAEDRNSTTVSNAKNPGVQHTYGIAPGQKTISWSANAKESFTVESLGKNAPSLAPGYQPTIGTGITGPGPAPAGITGPAPAPAGITGAEVGRTLGGIVGGDLGEQIGGWLGGLFDGVEIGAGTGTPLPTPNEGGGDSLSTPPCVADCKETGPGQDNRTNSANQSSAAFLSGMGFKLFEAVEKLFTRATIEPVVPEVDSVAAVLITVNDAAGVIELDRLDIIETLKDPSSYYTQAELDVLLAHLEEEFPILLDEDGQVVYSNGLYSPPVKDGVVLDSDTEYAYMFEYVDGNGQTVEPEKVEEGKLEALIRSIKTPASAISLSEVSKITYRLVDPDQTVARDEFYDYVLYLTDGTTRGTVLPQYSSISQMKGRFAAIGYQDDILTLISLAEETSEEPKSLMRDLIDSMQGLIGRFTKDEEGGAATDLSAALQTSAGEITVEDIETLFVYPAVDVPCPDVEGFESGFMYMAVLKDPNNPSRVITVTEGLCGQGTLEDKVLEAAFDLEETYGVKGALSDAIAEKINIYTDVVPYTPGIVATTLATEDNPETPELTELPTEEEPSSPAQLPNLTNEVIFEVKAVGSNGQVLADWTEAESIEIGSGVQLYFRWSGTAYQQCLPFLNDNGNYALTVSNRAMVTGNTESEGYNVSERSAVYRLECGGQRNNEFGVDAREIQVIVE